VADFKISQKVYGDIPELCIVALRLIFNVDAKSAKSMTQRGHHQFFAFDASLQSRRLIAMQQAVSRRSKAHQVPRSRLRKRE
jgi:hypothetical protein